MTTRRWQCILLKRLHGSMDVKKYIVLYGILFTTHLAFFSYVVLLVDID